MNNIILFDDDNWRSLLPLSYTRPIAEIRVGIMTIREKWSHYLEAKASYITQDYLSQKYPINIESTNIVINSRFLPNKKLIRLIQQLEINEALLHKDVLVATILSENQFQNLIEDKNISELRGMELDTAIDANDYILRPHDIFRLNDFELRKDFEALTKGRKSQPLGEGNQITQQGNIFIEEGAEVLGTFINAAGGPVYIGKDAKILEGCMVRGPFALCESSQLNMGAKVYGASTIGPWCKIGGEINNVVFQGYSNKAHDGFMGNSVIGEWCNLGADTNCSNLKNNYSEVKTWDYMQESFESTGLQFCGLIMGDHSKAGINTMFNTGTVVGVNCNIFGSGFPRNFIPSYSWGGSKGYVTYQLEKSMNVAQKVMKRRNLELSEADKLILEHIFKASAHYRQWES